MVSTAPAFTPPLTKQIFLTSWPKIGQKSEKWQWRHNFPEWRHHNNFLSCFLSLAKFSYWSKFHVNIITGFGIITIFFYKGLTRNPEIGNTPVWVLPNIWRLGQVMDTKFGTNVSNKILLNAAKFQGYSSYRFWVIKGKPNRARVKSQIPNKNKSSFLTSPLCVPDQLCFDFIKDEFEIQKSH